MLRQAMVDGELVDDEIALLETVRIAYGFDRLTHDKLLNDAKKSPIVSEKLITYKSTLITALDDGIITNDEDAMLSTLRKTLGITYSQHASLLAELRDKIK